MSDFLWPVGTAVISFVIATILRRIHGWTFGETWIIYVLLCVAGNLFGWVLQNR